MDFDYRAFIFIISLAAVINGLGLVRLLGAFAEYLRKQHTVRVEKYPVFEWWALYQFLLHILLWWSIWTIREIEHFSLPQYLYLLSGPVLLYLATSLLVPDIDGDRLVLRDHYNRVRPAFFSAMGLFWIWGLTSWPLLKGMVAPTWPILATNLAIAVTLRLTDNARMHAILTVLVWFVLLVFILVFGMQFGGIG